MTIKPASSLPFDSISTGQLPDRGSIIVTKPLTEAHAAGVQVSGTGIPLASALAKEHARRTQNYDNVPTLGAPNKYYKKAH